MRKYSLIAVLVLLAAACGDTGSDEPAAEAAATTAAPTTAAPTTAPSTTQMEMTDDSMHDDDEARHDDEMDDDEAMHDDEMGDDEAMTDEAGSGPVDRTIELQVEEFMFTPDAVLIAAGETVKFVVTNAGTVEHELRLSNAHRIEEHIASGHEDHGEEGEGGHHEEGGDVLILIAPGETEELTMEFPEDTTVYTEIVCLLPGHYEAGMSGALIYEG